MSDKQLWHDALVCLANCAIAVGLTVAVCAVFLAGRS